MAQTEEFTHFQPLGGSDEAATATGASGLTEDTPALTPLMIEATSGVLVKWDGLHAGSAVGVLALNTTAGQPNVTYYKSGTFRKEDLLWPDDVSDTVKRNAFAGTGVSIV